MTYRDILKNHKPVEISVRLLLSPGTAEHFNEREMFVGYAKWDGNKLIPTDGDCYSLDDELAGFLEMRDHLIVWERELYY